MVPRFVRDADDKQPPRSAWISVAIKIREARGRSGCRGRTVQDILCGVSFLYLHIGSPPFIVTIAFLQIIQSLGINPVSRSLDL
jgi:hypothetical protein